MFQVALAVGDGQLRPQLPGGTDPDLVNLANACFEADPLFRPSFTHVVTELSAICDKAQQASSSQQAQTSVLGRFMRSRPFI